MIVEKDKKIVDFNQLRELRDRSLGRLIWRMKRYMDGFMEPRLQQMGFTDFKTSYLAFLANIEEKGITNNELAKRACVTKQMMSKTVSVLEAEGYIYTEKSETDSRSNRIFMNDRGFELLYAEPPKEMDWAMWCGPAPLRAYNPTMHPKGFRGYLDYANGTLGDWGIHWMDQILWWTEEKHPRKVYSTGGRAIRQDSTDAPDHQVATFEFEGFTAVWEHRQFAGNNAEKTHPQQAVGVYFYGTEGTFHMGWLDGWTFYPTDSKKPVIHQDAQLNKPDDQNIAQLWANFLACIKTNKTPISDIEIGQRSTNMALLGMLSMKLGRSVEWDGNQIPNDPEANKLLSRAYRGEWQYPV